MLAREANLAVQDAGFAGELRASLLADDRRRGGACRGQDMACRAAGLDRLVARVSYWIVRLLIGLLGYSRSR